MIPEAHKPKTRRGERLATPDATSLLNEFVTTTTDGYLGNAFQAVDCVTGNYRHFGGMALVSGCLQSYVTLHAAQLVATAVNRNTEAIKALIKAKGV